MVNKEEKIKKVYKLLFTAILVTLFLAITLNEFIEADFGKNIETMIGPEYSGGASISVKENIILKSTIDIYIQTIHSGDLEGAYDYLLPQYQEYISKEIYMQKMQEIGTENFVIQAMELKHETENMFSFDITLKNETKLKLLLILAEENYYIVPEPFLKYEDVNKEITKKGVTYNLKGYQVDLERCIFDMVITNNTNDEIEITQVKMTSTAGGIRNAVNQKTKIQPHETLEVPYKVETYLDFPASLELTRKDGEKIRVYTFEL